MIWVRFTAAVAVLAAAAALSGCSHPSQRAKPAAPTSSDTPLITETPAGSNANDVAFATNMVKLQEQGVKIAALAKERTTDATLKNLADTIATQELSENQTTKVFLVQWENDPNPPDPAKIPVPAMQGLLDDPTLARLKSLTGREFDTLWCRSMITHHDGAVAMANAELAGGENSDAKTMAKSILDSHQAQLGQPHQLGGG